MLETGRGEGLVNFFEDFRQCYLDTSQADMTEQAFKSLAYLYTELLSPYPQFEVLDMPNLSGFMILLLRPKIVKAMKKFMNEDQDTFSKIWITPSLFRTFS